jgi:hypothetical protein
MIRLVIDEEYGYRTWLAELTLEEYAQLLARWETMRGLSCLVPIKLVIPQAVEISDEDVIKMHDNGETYYRCHMHDYDDSYLEGSRYDIPEDTHFWMNGRKYEEPEYWPELKVLPNYSFPNHGCTNDGE